jgi:hypothetical protein
MGKEYCMIDSGDRVEESWACFLQIFANPCWVGPTAPLPAKWPEKQQYPNLWVYELGLLL